MRAAPSLPVEREREGGNTPGQVARRAWTNQHKIAELERYIAELSATIRYQEAVLEAASAKGDAGKVLAVSAGIEANQRRLGEHKAQLRALKGEPS